MEVKIDSAYIREQRERRAWSQEHLAAVTGLGLRTIQRIEKTGAASYESARALAAVLRVDVANLRVAQAPAPVPVPAIAPRRAASGLRPLLAAAAALATTGALFYATSSSADQVLMDVSLALESTQESRAAATQFLVEDGTLVPGVNEITFGDVRFSIVPRVREGGRILLEIAVYEQRGDEEVLVSEPRLVALSGEEAGVVIDTGESTLRLGVTAQVNPPKAPPALRVR